jgi:hypothetical protein
MEFYLSKIDKIFNLRENSFCSLEDNMHQTTLHLVIIKENYELVEYLITLPNINVCIRDKQGE